MRSNKRQQDDEFDFLDQDILDQPVKNSKPSKTKPQDDDYLGFDDEDYKPSNKLPTISSNKNSVLMKSPISNLNSNRVSTKLEAISTKQPTKNNISSYDDEDGDMYGYYEEVAEQPVATSNQANAKGKGTGTNNINNNGSYNYDDDEDPGSPNKDTSVMVSTPKKMAVSEKQHDPQEQEQDNYGEDFEADEYGQDFEDFHDEKPKQVKPQPTITKQLTSDNIRHSAKQSTFKTLKKQLNFYVRLDKIIPRQQNLYKSNSRRSLNSKPDVSRSQNGQRNTNKSKVKSTVTPLLSNSNDDHKFENQVNSNFPDSTNLQSQTVDTLNKQNEKVRAMIKRLNDQLNDILTKNTLLLKANQAKKNANKSKQTAEDKLKVLQEERRNNQKILQRMQAEIKKMRFREGKIKQEEYQIDMQKLVQSAVEEKKALEKQIYKLKLDINNDGKRLQNNNNGKKESDGLHAVKTELIHQKKQEERYLRLSEETDQKISDKQDKQKDTDSRLRKIMKEAEELGIDIEPKNKMQAKYEQLKKKEDAAKKGLQLADANNKVKQDRMTQENLLLRRKIQNEESEIKNMFNQVQHVVNQCVAVIQKSKENPKLMKNIQNSLDMISKSLVQPTEPSVSQSRIMGDFDRYSQKGLQNKSAIMGQNKIRASSSAKGNKNQNNSSNPLKVHNKSNNQSSNRADESQRKQQTPPIQKQKEEEFLPLNPKQLSKNIKDSVVEEEQPSQNVMKPNFKKKEASKEEFKNAHERIWKEEEKPQQQIPEVKAHQPPAPVIEQPKPSDNSKPSFMFRKRGNNANPEPPKQEVHTISSPPISQPPVAHQEPNLVIQEKKQPEGSSKPFGKFQLRRRNNDSVTQENPVTQTPAPAPPAKQFESPVAEPNSFSQPPTVATTEEVKPAGPRRFMMRKKQDEENNENAYNPTFKKQPTPAPEEAKPQPITVNLNRIQNQKPAQPVENHENEFKNPYAPSTQTPAANPYAPKEQNSLPPRNRSNPYAPAVEQPKVEAPVQNVNNPYIQQQSAAYAPREKQGKVKKIKVENNAPKQKINIFEAAQQVVANQFVGGGNHAPITVQVTQQQPKQQQQQHAHHEQELDINKLLGISDTKQDLPFEQPKPVERKRFGGGAGINISNNNNAKKVGGGGQDDFFGGLNI